MLVKPCVVDRLACFLFCYACARAPYSVVAVRVEVVAENSSPRTWALSCERRRGRGDGRAEITRRAANGRALCLVIFALYSVKNNRKCCQFKQHQTIVSK